MTWKHFCITSPLYWESRVTDEIHVQMASDAELDDVFL